MNILEKIALNGIIAGALIIGGGMYNDNKTVKGFGGGIILGSIAYSALGLVIRRINKDNPEKYALNNSGKKE